jgi:hypothetical protein
VRLTVTRTRAERGAAAVEFALVLPLLVVLMFGMVWTALAYSDHLSVTNAVREGARYGSAIDYSDPSWATSVRDRVKQVYYNAGGTLTDNEICVRLLQSDGTILSSWTGTSCGGAPTAPSMSAGSCAVMVWVKKPRKVELVVFPTMHFDIGARSVGYYGRTVDPGCTASS